jgi:hypothetical protein
MTGRLRRPVAWGAAVALLAVILPAVPATASDPAGFATFASGELVVGKSATFDITCGGIPNSQGATVKLMRSSSTMLTVTPTMTPGGADNDIYTGQATFDLSSLTAGTYFIRLECKLQYGGYQPYANASGNFQISAPVVDAATATALSVNPTQVVTGQETTFTATVPGAVGGTVAFQQGGATLQTVALTGGQAQYRTTPTESATLTAVYSGGPGYLGSTSGGATVSVISSITQPGGLSMGGNPKVGVQSTATVLGQWSPTAGQGLTETYEWRIGTAVVSTAATYTPVAADAGKALSLTITGTHPALGSAPLTLTLPVQVGDAIYGDLLLDGAVDHEATLGTPLSARAVGWSPTATLSYRWYVNGTPVSTATTYTPQLADLGKMISVELTVTEAGRETTGDTAYVWNVVTTPTVTVGSSTITVGKDATLPVTVAGPAGAPVASGAVSVRLTPASGSAITVEDMVLDGSGKVTVTVPDLAVGRYAVSVTYLPTALHITAGYSVAASIGGESNPYLTATGTGSVTVVKPIPTADFPSTLTVPVATAGKATLTVSGKARPAEYVLMSGSTELQRGAVPVLGSVTLTLPVLAPGTHELTLVLLETATTARVATTLTVTVAGEPARTGSVPTAELATPKAATTPGQTMDLVADGFQPGETVAFYVHSDPVYLGTAVADAHGIARLTATIPADLPVGAHTVIATGGTSGRWAQLAIELAVPGATPTAATPAVASDQILATTGAGSGSALAGAWLLLAVGAGLVLVVRRVRTVRGAA